MAKKNQKQSKAYKQRKQPSGWVHVVSGISGCKEDNVMLFGVNIFAVPWESTGQRVTVYDPLRGHPYDFPVYTVEVNGRKHQIAYGEYAMNIGGLYCKNG